jgi:hypothetical protein
MEERTGRVLVVVLEPATGVAGIAGLAVARVDAPPSPMTGRHKNAKPKTAEHKTAEHETAEHKAAAICLPMLPSPSMNEARNSS